MSSLVPFTDKSVVPLTGDSLPAPADQKEALAALSIAAGRAQKTGMGADGSIVATIEHADRRRFWIEDRFPVEFDSDQLAAIAQSYESSGKQEMPLCVVKLQNPKMQAKSHDGKTDQNLLIVNADGMAFFRATLGSKSSFDFVAEEYNGGYYQLLLRMGRAKAQQYTLSRVEKGNLYRAARAAYEAESIQRHQRGDPSLDKFPALEVVAAEFGCASKSDMSACVIMAEAVDGDPDIKQIVESGAISEDGLREIARLPAPERLEVAQQLAQHHEETGTYAPRDVVRDVKAAVRETPSGSGERIKLFSDKPARKPIPWQTVAVVFSARNLSIAQADDSRAEMAAPVVLGRLLSDIEMTLDEMNDATPKEAAAFVKRVRDLLASTDAQELMQQSKPQ